MFTGVEVVAKNVVENPSAAVLVVMGSVIKLYFLLPSFLVAADLFALVVVVVVVAVFFLVVAFAATLVLVCVLVVEDVYLNTEKFPQVLQKCTGNECLHLILQSVFYFLV